MGMEAISPQESSRINGRQAASLAFLLGPFLAFSAIVLNGCGSAPSSRPSPAPPPAPPPAASGSGSGARSSKAKKVEVAGDHRPTGRGWLVADRPEPPGFGLYSYLLFGSLPSDATRPLYLAVIKATIGKVEPIERELQVFQPIQLNLYMVPLLSDPPPDAQPNDLANWIVDHYNYPRAQKILATLPNRRTGVYILSVLSKPVDPSLPLQPPYLWQDLSNVEPAIATAWIQYFLDQAAKDRPWEESMGDKLALDLRNNIQQVATQMQATIPALITAIRWFKPGS